MGVTLSVEDLYTYSARLFRVVDGDTAVLDVDLGGHIHAHWTCRVRGIDAPARTSKPGASAAAAIAALLGGTAFLVRTIKDEGDRYGRYLVTITLPDGTDVAEQMVAEHKAVHWDGHGPHPDQPGAEGRPGSNGTEHTTHEQHLH